MQSLRELLQEKARDEDKLARLKAREEWVVAVTGLMNQLNGWLREADPQGLLTIYITEDDKLEAGLGRYTVPTLHVEFDERHVRIAAIGRNVPRHRPLGTDSLIAPTGRIDIWAGGDKYTLYRLSDDSAQRWIILGHQGKMVSLDQARFEAIMGELLS
jgi:hypothetical protein